MKICTYGAKHLQGQLPRIEQGFITLGQEIVNNPSEADLIYCNNPWYDDLAKDFESGKIDRTKTKIICTVLDLAPHLGDGFPVQKLKDQLDLYADAICTISESVQADLKNRTGYRSHVIYQPIKQIYKTEKYENSPYKILFVGRVNDENKRCVLAAEALLKLGYTANQIVTVGSDRPFYGGVWGGPVDDSVLNKLYNTVDFVMFPSKFEGIGLPAIEAMAAGAIPVICNDLSTRQDFFSGISEYDKVNPDSDSISDFMAKFIVDEEKKQDFKDKLRSYYLENLVYKMSGTGVANKILDVYEELLWNDD